MINPVVVIISISFLLSMLVVCVINKPRKPVMTGSIILLLIFYISVTFIIDGAITGTGINEQFGDFVKFLVMSDIPSYEELSDSFRTFMKIDISLVAITLVSMFIEIMLIFRKESKK